MVSSSPKSQQTLIYLTGGLTMLTASLGIFNSLPIYIIIFSIAIGILSIIQIERQFVTSKREISSWGLNLLRISRTVAPEAYTSVEITPVGYKPRRQVQESLTEITAYVVSRVAKHVKTQKTEIKIDQLEETSLLYIQVKGRANSELDANQLIQLTDEEIESKVRSIKGSTMYESNNGETTILIEFPNKQ